MSNSGGKWIRPARRMAIYHRDDFHCVYCDWAPLNNPLTLDHVVSLKDGGTHHERNLVTCCLSCNSAKGAKSIRAWYKSMRYDGYDTDLIRRRIRHKLNKPIDRAEGKRLEQKRKKQ